MRHQGSFFFFLGGGVFILDDNHNGRVTVTHKAATLSAARPDNVQENCEILSFEIYKHFFFQHCHKRKNRMFVRKADFQNFFEL